MAEPAILDLVASSAQTASGAGAALDAEKAGRSVTVALSSTVATGTGKTLLVVIEHSETGLDGWGELARFPSLTGASNVSLSAGGAKRYLRARWEIAGTTPSFTFAVKARAYSHLITRQQFFNRVSPAMARRAFDDGQVGEAAEEAIDALLADASSMLRGKLGPVDDLSGLTPETRSEAVRIGLDICQARAAIRHPEVFRIDGGKLLECARKDLKEIRTGLADAAMAPQRPPIESLAAGATSLPRRWV